MKSPFPGMDPYLELWWRDIHQKVCTYACDAIQPQLASGLKARLGERLVVEAAEYERSIYPDVRIVEGGRLKEGAEAPEGSAAAVVETESLVVQLGSEPARQAYIEIIDLRNNNRLITAIEFLSPSNKLPGNGREQYVQKQEEPARPGPASLRLTSCGRGTGRHWRKRICRGIGTGPIRFAFTGPGNRDNARSFASL